MAMVCNCVILKFRISENSVLVKLFLTNRARVTIFLMNLPALDNLNVRNKRVLLRLDLDVPVARDRDRLRVADDTRLLASIPTIKYLLEHRCGQIVILGHRGRPGGKKVNSLSLSPVAEYLEKLIEKELGQEVVKSLDMYVAENLRFHKGEVEESEKYAKDLAVNGDVYVNDAFAASNREHSSITLLPKLLPHAAGLHLAKEVWALERVLENPKRPVVFVLGGGKLDKALLVDKLLEHADWVLVGGILPKKVKSYCRDGRDGVCVAAAHLTPGGDDINPDSAKNFAEIIKDAGTLVWNGPMGDIDNGFWDGTKIIAQGIVKSRAFKVVGGGDTTAAAQRLRILGRFNHVSTGGGSMLEFLAYGDLPGLAALRDR